MDNHGVTPISIMDVDMHDADHRQSAPINLLDLARQPDQIAQRYAENFMDTLAFPNFKTAHNILYSQPCSYLYPSYNPNVHMMLERVYMSKLDCEVCEIAMEQMLEDEEKINEVFYAFMTLIRYLALQAHELDADSNDNETDFALDRRETKIAVEFMQTIVLRIWISRDWPGV